MKNERKEVIEALNREIEEVTDIAVIRFILNVTHAFKRKWGV